MVSAPSSKPMNSVDSGDGSTPSNDPFANGGGAPLVIDLSNIPNPSDIGDGDVW